jgi:uncharacterized protein YcfJ
MKGKIVFLPLLLTLTSLPLHAGQGQYEPYRDTDEFTVKARVNHVEPLIEVVQTPHQNRECWDEEVSGSHTRRSSDGTLVGAIIGGVIGHNIGDRRHRGVTTAMGTMIGATIGHDSDHETYSPYRYTEQHCQVSTNYTEEERISGYRVSYEYHGTTYVTHMDRDPGKFIRLRVSLQPLD